MLLRVPEFLHTKGDARDRQRTSICGAESPAAPASAVSSSSSRCPRSSLRHASTTAATRPVIHSDHTASQISRVNIAELGRLIPHRTVDRGTGNGMFRGATAVGTVRPKSQVDPTASRLGATHSVESLWSIMAPREQFSAVISVAASTCGVMRMWTHKLNSQLRIVVLAGSQNLLW